VGSGDPALVVRLCPAGDGGSIGTHNGNLLSRVDLLGAARRLLRTLAALAAATLLGEKGGDPGVVDKVDGATKGSQEDDIEEDARKGKLVVAQSGPAGLRSGIAYICGSKMLVGASTTVTVSLKAETVKKACLLS
jgi:hypothetical protein